MKSFKNHTSLIVALLGILFSIQIFTIVQRAIESYEANLLQSYSVVVVSDKRLDTKMVQKDPLIQTITPLLADHVIKKLNMDMSKRSIELLKITLPKFYKITLAHYPTPKELGALKKRVLGIDGVRKIETFAKAHTTTYKLLLLFEDVIAVFAVATVVVTLLLIAKELRIWQFKHSERMSIMGLFGAPAWLRSAVLFRLAIVDAFLATLFAFVTFSYVSSLTWVTQQLHALGIEIVLFDPIYDTLVMFGISLLVALTLVTFVVLGHKEEV